MPVTTEFVTKGAEKAARDIAKVSGGLSGMASTAGKASAALLGAGAAAGALVDDIVGQIDEMNTFAQATGLSIDTIKGLSIEAKRTGKDLKDLVPKDLAKRMREAGQGSKLAVEGFQDLGISLEDLDTLTPDETFARVIDGLQGIDDEGERAAIAAQLLGKNGRQMLSAFSTGSEGLEDVVQLGREFGIDVGPDAQKAASDWQEATMELSLAFDQAKASIQPFIGTAASLVSDFALGATFALASVSDYVDLIGTRLSLFASGEWGALAESVAEEGLGINSAMEAGTKSAKAYFTALQDLNTEAKPLLEEGETKPEDKPIVKTFRAAREEAERLTELVKAFEDQPWVKEQAEGWEEIEESWEGLVEAAQDYADGEFWDEIDAKMAIAIAAAEEHAAKQKAFVAAVSGGAVSIARDASEAVANLAQDGSAAAKVAAMVHHGINKGVAVADIAMKTKQAFMAAATIGPPQSFVAQGIVLAQGAASALAVASQPPPSFHIGHRAADEYSATLRAGERVLAPQAVDALGGPEGVARANAGAAAPYTGQVTIQMDSETIGTAFQRLLQDPDSPLSAAFRGMTPAVR